MEKLLLKPLEVAEALGISRSRVYLLLREGGLPSVQVGHTTRVPADALRRWVTEQQVSGGEPRDPERGQGAA